MGRKRDAVRLVAMSLSVLVGGLLFVAGSLNVVLAFQGAEGTPSITEAAAVTAFGAVLLGVPGGIALRDTLRAARG